jgi:phosphatidate phosphatase PAH1
MYRTTQSVIVKKGKIFTFGNIKKFYAQIDKNRLKIKYLE